MKKVSLFICSIFLIQSCTSQKIENEIPFRLTKYNNIIVSTVINDKDSTQLMLHTGSDYISLIERSLPKFKTLQINDTIKGVTSWAGYSDQGISINNVVQLGKNNFNKIPIFIDQQSGHESDGKIGMKFFKDQYLEINFDTNKLIVYKETPRHLKNFESIESRYENETLLFKGFPLLDNKLIETEFMLHTGYSGAIIFSDQYVKNNLLLEKFKPTGETKFSDAAGNQIISKKSILPEFKFGKSMLTNLPISYFDSEVKIQHVNIFGGDLIKRFNWILSPDLKTIYFKPNKNFNEEYFKL